MEHHIGAKINLWPAYDADGPEGHYTDEELEAEKALRETIEMFEERFARSGLLIDAPPSDAIRFIE